MAFETSLFGPEDGEVDGEGCAIDALLRNPGAARIGAYPSGRSAGQMQNAAAGHWFTACPFSQFFRWPTDRFARNAVLAKRVLSWWNGRLAAIVKAMTRVLIVEDELLLRLL